MSSVYHLPRTPEFGRSATLADYRLLGGRIARLLDTVIWWGALLLIPLVAIPEGSDQLWWQAAFECYAFGLGILWIVNGFFKGHWRLRGGSLWIPLLLMAAYAFLQTLPLIPQGEVGGNFRAPISANATGTYHFIAELSALVILSKLLLDYAGDKKHLRSLIYVVTGVGVLSAAFGVLRFIAQEAWPGFVIFGKAAGEGFAHFGNRNYFALLLEIPLGLELGILLSGGVRKQFLPLRSGIVLLLATTIILTSSRGGVLSLLSQIVFLGSWFVLKRVWRNSQSSERGRSGGKLIGKLLLSGALISAVIVVPAIAIVNVGGDPLANRMNKLPAEFGSEEDSAHGQRGDIWRATWALIKDHPIGGVGFGAYYTAIPRYHVASGTWIPSSALNDYLNLLAGGGLIALVLSAWFVAMLMRKVLQNLKSPSAFRQAATVGALGGLVGVATHSLVDAGLQVPINAVLFLVLIVIASADFSGRRVLPISDNFDMAK